MTLVTFNDAIFLWAPLMHWAFSCARLAGVSIELLTDLLLSKCIESSTLCQYSAGGEVEEVHFMLTY